MCNLPAQQVAPATSVNPVLGDTSFIEKFGRAPVKTDDCDIRTKTHLEFVEQKLRASKPSLTAEQLKNRERILDLLNEYHTAGKFPRNYDYDENRPCFIDEDGTICAVGYLVEQTAGREVAEQINAKYKYEYLLNMHDEALESWIASSGLTKEECAMIQPTYGYNNRWGVRPASPYMVSFGYGIANQPDTWINDIYIRTGEDVYKINPRSVNHMSLSFTRNFSLRKGLVNAGIGIRREHYKTNEQYRSLSRNSSGNLYSGMVAVSYLKSYRLLQGVRLFWEAGVNFQLYNIFYKDRGFEVTGSKGTYTSAPNEVVPKNEEFEVRLFQKSPHTVIPQAALGLGCIFTIGKQNIRTSANVEYDMLRSSYYSYHFKVNDKINNLQYEHNQDIRAMTRVYFSVKLGYEFSFKRRKTGNGPTF